MGKRPADEFMETEEFKRWIRASAAGSLRRNADPDYLRQVGEAAAAGAYPMDEFLDAYNEGKKNR